MTPDGELIGQPQKYCHAELVSASALDIVHRFRNKFGMTPDGELIGQPQKYCHAELVSASPLDIVHRFRNEF